MRALHHYESRGLPTPDRSSAGHRIYGPEHVAQLYRIVALRDLGLSLAEIEASLAGQELGTTVE